TLAKLRELHPTLYNKVMAFQNIYKTLPEDAKVFIDRLFVYGVRSMSALPSLGNWNLLKAEFQGKISKSSCSQLLDKFPPLKNQGELPHWSLLE
ncbi:hypothetical protein GCK32_020867, partial [Trichostrongylus colubriformis]